LQRAAEWSGGAGRVDRAAQQLALTQLVLRAEQTVTADRILPTDAGPTTPHQPTRPGAGGGPGGDAQAHWDQILFAYGLSHTDEDKQNMSNEMVGMMQELANPRGDYRVREDRVQAAALHAFDVMARGATIGENGRLQGGTSRQAALREAATWAGGAHELDQAAQQIALTRLVLRADQGVSGDVDPDMAARMAQIGSTSGSAGARTTQAALTGQTSPGRPPRDRNSPQSGRPAVDPQDIDITELARRLQDPVFKLLRAHFMQTLERKNPTAR
jgi:hypothetical protein